MAGAPMLTVVDLVIVAVVVLAAMHGWRLGLSGFAFGLAGLVAGGLVGLWIAGWLIGTHWSPPVHLLLELGCVVVAALLGSAIGARLGGAAGHLLNRTHLRLPDRAVGAAVRGALALGVCWLLAAAVTAIGAPTPVVSAVQDSAVLRQVSDALPSPTELVADLSTQLQLPADLAGLVPNSGVGTLPAAQVSAASAAAAPSVVKIEGTGCGSVEGSGFVTDGGLVVTNAHVVAGATALTVTDRRGTHRAESLIVDGAADIAVLRADSVQAPALSLTTEPVANGTPAVILGYPATERSPLSPLSSYRSCRCWSPASAAPGWSPARCTDWPLQSAPATAVDPCWTPQARSSGWSTRARLRTMTPASRSRSTRCGPTSQPPQRGRCPLTRRLPHVRRHGSGQASRLKIF